MAEDRMLNDEILLGLIKANGGGGGGTSDYPQLTNKPQINGTTLIGNKSASDLGLASAQSVSNITNGENINNFAGVENALDGKQDALTAGANINMTSNVVKAGVIEVVEPDMTVYGNSTESGSKTYTIETTGVYEIFYCLSLQSTVSVTLPNDANVLFENDLTVSSHPVKHIIVELHEGDTVTITQTPSQWNAVISGVLKLDAISVVDVAYTGSVADNTITYTLPNDNKYYLVVGACAGKPTGNNAVDSTSGGNAEITRTLTGSGVRFRSVVVKGSDSPSFSFYGYDGGVAAVIAYEIEFEEGNWDYNLATKNYVDNAIDMAVASAYHHAGTKTCAELVAGLLVATNEGNVYNMTDSGTTTSDFIEGQGQPIKAGDNVGVAKISDGVYKFDLLSGFVDTTNFVQKSQTAGLLKNDGTVDTTIQGDVDSLKSGLTTLSEEVNGDATVYPYADVITIEDAVPANLADCSVKIEPVQDLHGYDKPWVGGAGKQELIITVSDIKTANTAGTWNGNAYTLNGITYTVNTDTDGNVTSITASGTSDSVSTLGFYTSALNGNNALNGCPSGGGNSSYNITLKKTNNTGEYIGEDSGNGFSFTLSEATVMYAYIRVARGYEISGTLTFYPMIRDASITDATFAPYTNICPITGHTEVDVQRDGKNLVNWKLNTYNDNPLVKTLWQGNYTLSTRTTSTNNNWYIKGIKPDGTYCSKSELGLSLFSNASESGLYYGGYNNDALTFSVPSDGIRVRIGRLNADGTIPAQLEMGTVATDFEDYAGKTYTIALGDTIYGGTVDFDSGVMTVTHAVMDMGSVTWTAIGATPHLYQYTGMQSDVKKPASNDDVVDSYCECYAVASTNTVSAGTTGFAITTGGTLRIYDDVVSDATALNTELSGKNLVYELATPTTIQLTPQQIQLLKGQNTLYASTGQISVTVNGVSGAIGAVQEQVNGLEARVASAESNITTLQSGFVKKTLIFSGISSKVITFSGQIHCRNVAMFLVCGGQTGVGNPISIMFTGESTGVHTMTSVQVAANSDGVTASGLSITIPAELYGEWGNHMLIELYPDDSYTYTVTDAT